MCAVHASDCAPNNATTCDPVTPRDHAAQLDFDALPALGGQHFGNGIIRKRARWPTCLICKQSTATVGLAGEHSIHASIVCYALAEI